MPDTAFVAGKALCPSCGTHLLNNIRCQWGVVPGTHYNLTDSVIWLKNTSGQIVEAFTLYQVENSNWQWNCGDPQYLSVLLFDEDIYSGNYQLQCPNCKLRVAAGVAIVRGGKFQEILALSDVDVDRILGGSRGKANIVIVRDDQSFWPREDWYDHTVKYEGVGKS